MKISHAEALHRFYTWKEYHLGNEPIHEYMHVDRVELEEWLYEHDLEA